MLARLTNFPGSSLSSSNKGWHDHGEWLSPNLINTCSIFSINLFYALQLLLIQQFHYKVHTFSLPTALKSVGGETTGWIVEEPSSMSHYIHAKTLFGNLWVWNDTPLSHIELGYAVSYGLGRCSWICPREIGPCCITM